LSIALYWPFHLVLAGIVLRGASFVFSAHGRAAGHTPLAWGATFGAASVITPLLLGASLGTVSAGQIRVVQGTVAPGATWAWLAPFPLATGLLALAVCAYLAAVYLTLETEGRLQDDFRERALQTWFVAGILAAITLVLTRFEAPHLWNNLVVGWAAMFVGAGILLAPASFAATYRRRYRLARVCAVGQVIVLLVGWALALRPYLVYPDVTLDGSAAPIPTLRFILASVPVGLALVLPSLWFLFDVFKGRNPAAPAPSPRSEPPGSL
ncbi:MAG TPA: cytochrome d ubiquinol oxidase subunit II, partial [Chloroflexota bacterium]|nr:cytochrome d ubiquinol oxidase subunit II [Chloroflexota bacterium]